MDLKLYLIDCIVNERSVVEELLAIDNNVQYTKVSYDIFLEKLEKINFIDKIDSNFDYVAITDGEFDTVFKVLISVYNLSYIYINRSYLGINSYLVNRVNQFYGFEKIVLDDSINYQKYIHNKNKVIISGFDTFVEELSKEFINNEVVVL